MMAKICTSVHVEGSPRRDLGHWLCKDLSNRFNFQSLMNYTTLVACSNHLRLLFSSQHGAAAQSRTLSDLAYEVKIVGANGTLNTFTREKDPVEFSAAVCNLGLLGVIYSYTLHVEPILTLTHPKQTDVPETISALWNAFRKVRQYISSIYGKMTFKIMSTYPRLTPLVNYLINIKTHSKSEKVLAAPDAIRYQHNLQAAACVGLECVFKVDEGFENPIHEYAVCGKCPVDMTLDMRFIKSSDQIMSHVYDKDPETIFCTVEILSAAKTRDFEDFSAMLAQHWISEYKARVHWAKLWEHIAGIIPYLREQAEPQLDQFESVRQKYDPQGMFLNKTFAEVLGHSGFAAIDFDLAFASRTPCCYPPE
ncbi:hypothetical protein BGZ47_000093 [Haplosporangium gracile]|nr:hypothetical protein BGZ47_000093 [Haplosporangium gracile]